jgi:hypothetical protein
VRLARHRVPDGFDPCFSDARDADSADAGFAVGLERDRGRDDAKPVGRDRGEDLERDAPPAGRSRALRSRSAARLWPSRQSREAPCRCLRAPLQGTTARWHRQHHRAMCRRSGPRRLASRRRPRSGRLSEAR